MFSCRVFFQVSVVFPLFFVTVSCLADQSKSTLERLIAENLSHCSDKYLKLSDLPSELKDDPISPQVTRDANIPSDQFAIAASLDGDDSLILNISFKEEARKVARIDLQSELNLSVWCLGFMSENLVKSHNFSMTDFDLPKGASLWFYSTTNELIIGPYEGKDGCRLTDDDHGSEFWSPVVPGNKIIMFVLMPENPQEPSFIINGINQGFRELGFGKRRCEGAHEDVMSQAGYPYIDQINSVALITREGTKVCTGQMINSYNLKGAADEGEPKNYFLTSDHCVNKENACSLGFYWDFHSPKNRDDDVIQDRFTPGGSVLVVEGIDSDFALVRLNQAPSKEYEVFHAGWDAGSSDQLKYESAVTLHHPSGDLMSIAVKSNPPISGARRVGDPENFWFVNTWESGFTENGSSGACLWTNNGHCIGQLWGAGQVVNCEAKPAYFGKFSESWCNKKGSEEECDADISLQPYLSPGDSSQKCIDGAYFYGKESDLAKERDVVNRCDDT